MIYILDDHEYLRIAKDLWIKMESDISKLSADYQIRENIYKLYMLKKTDLNTSKVILHQNWHMS